MKKIDYLNYKRPSDYMKFEQGDNRVRVVSSGAMGYSHGLKTARAWVPLGICTGEGCEHCEKGNEAKRFWRWIVYDFNEDDLKMLDAGPVIGNGICELAAKLKADPQDYDIIVNRVGEKRNTKYSVSRAKDSKPMTNKDIASKKKYLIAKYFKPKNDR